MPYFKNSDEVYDIQRAFFERISRDQVIGPQLEKSKLVIRFKVHDPETVITINCRDLPEGGKFFATVFGESDLKPDLTLLSSADVQHEFWLGKVNIVTALLAGKMRAEGDVTQAIKFMPVLKPMIEIYPQVLRDLGRSGLIVK